MEPPPLAIHLDRTKTSTGEQDDNVYLAGQPVEALNAWMAAAKIESRSVFRGIGRWGTVSKSALDPQSVNAIFKQRAEMAGLERGQFPANGLRSGYLTEAANRGIPLPEPMEQSHHRSVQEPSSYCNNAARLSGLAIRFFEPHVSLAACRNGENRHEIEARKSSEAAEKRLSSSRHARIPHDNNHRKCGRRRPMHSNGLEIPRVEEHETCRFKIREIACPRRAAAR
ncbi:integrase family protein [Rhizobium sp. CF080]|nr:integrase family protein [Rhizobium sp. CF080]